MLDEVFGGQDRERRRAVLRALGGLLPPFRQVLLVTHVEDIPLPSIIRVVEASDGSARCLSGGSLI
jgi:DNA repair exonuclease SbcCD ATPase subunit